MCVYEFVCLCVCYQSYITPLTFAFLCLTPLLERETERERQRGEAQRGRERETERERERERERQRERERERQRERETERETERERKRESRTLPSYSGDLKLWTINNKSQTYRTEAWLCSF